MQRALMWLYLYGREAVLHKNTKKAFFACFACFGVYVEMLNMLKGKGKDDEMESSEFLGKKRY